MAEYIEREAIKYEQWSVGLLNDPLMVVRKRTIDGIPAADVAPVRHGRWVWDDRSTERGFVWGCSACLEVNDRKEKYCPNCGARMDGDPE